ncbi:PCP degradation transcriptional activation protein [Thalassocella blandensis]|nr:PCP degradation transcriptional activation protein [Thalassocella blandensis]
MRLSQLDLNLFPVFDAIYTKRNLTRAAEVLCVTQPAVSNALARMRKSFNDPLFVSTPQGMVPTPIAKRIHQQVSEALQLLDSSVQLADSFAPAQANLRFRFSMNDMSESILLPRLNDVLEKEAPGISIESYFTPRRDLPQALSNGDLDLAFDAPLLNEPQLLHDSLLSTPYVCFVRKNHPVVSSVQDNTLSLEAYLALEHIHVSGRRRGMGVVDSELNRMSKARKIKLRVQHYLVAPVIAQRSDLILSGPELLLRDYEGHMFEIPFPLPEESWHLYWHKSADQDKANQWMREKIAEITSTLAQ